MDVSGNKQGREATKVWETKASELGTSSISETKETDIELELFKLMTSKPQNLDPESTRADLSLRIEKVGDIINNELKDAEKSPRARMTVTAAEQWMKAMIINAGSDKSSHA